ncbi:MAG: L-aspartate oxidase [Dehalococcoidia bacterium]
MDRFETIVVGSGIAGLYTAILARELGSVLVLTKSRIDEANTRYAQGGIAAAIGAGDSPAGHLSDTVAAGAGLVDAEAAAILTGEAADRIADLVRLGVPFDRADGAIALGREAAHGAARILHAGGDATGFHMEMTLAALARTDGITVREGRLVTALDLRRDPCTDRVERVTGVRALDTATGAEEVSTAARVVLASAAPGRLYRYTTNPEVATGDGIALAYRAGAEVMDLEFMQFHPTALRLPGAPVFLISEAVRGEGAVLHAVDGRRFMPAIDPRAELAPRDVVARAIVAEMARTGADHVDLDLTTLPADYVTARFPQIARFCAEHGLDIARQPIPVSPAAHYTMGGVRTNTWGETTLPGLYAAGEAACTGVHGANRLASNSLLETVVFAKRVVERMRGATGPGPTPTPDAMTLPPSAPAESGPPDLAALQTLMWEKVGIVRDGAGLDLARRTFAGWQAAMPSPCDRAGHELANLVLLGRLAAEAAYRREESRGAHYRTDYPAPVEAWRRHIVFRADA